MLVNQIKIHQVAANQPKRTPPSTTPRSSKFKFAGRCWLPRHSIFFRRFTNKGPSSCKFPTKIYARNLLALPIWCFRKGKLPQIQNDLSSTYKEKLIIFHLQLLKHNNGVDKSPNIFNEDVWEGSKYGHQIFNHILKLRNYVSYPTCHNLTARWVSVIFRGAPWCALSSMVRTL